MDLIQEYIKLDQQFTNIQSTIVSLLQHDAILQNHKSHKILITGNKLAVFEQDNKVYKVVIKTHYYQYVGLQYLFNNILSLSHIILPYNFIYIGDKIFIIEQPKLQRLQHRDLKTLYSNTLPDMNSMVQYDHIDIDLNKYYYLNLSYEDYTKLFAFFNLICPSDLFVYNFGINKQNEIMCFDFECHNNNISLKQLQDFINIYSTEGFNQIVAQYPEIMFLINAN